MNDPQMLRQVSRMLAFTAAGAATGVFGQWFVWSVFAAIGRDVISDDVYFGRTGGYPGWGLAAGALSGFAAGLLPRAWAYLAFALAHSLAFTNALALGGNTHWRLGMAAYFGSHAVALFACALLSVTPIATAKRSAE